MPLCFFRIINGRYSAARKELTILCTDMASGTSRKLAENSKWRMEMLEEKQAAGIPHRIVAETLD